MDKVLAEGVFYGVRALHYMQGKQYRIMYMRERDKRFIGDMPIIGIKEPWDKEALRYSITRLFTDAWREKAIRCVNRGGILKEFLFDFEEGEVKHGSEYYIFDLGEWCELD